MRESSIRRSYRFTARHRSGRQADNPVQSTRPHQIMMTLALAVGATVWVHGVVHAGSTMSHAPYLGLDLLLAIPVAGLAVAAAAAIARRFSLSPAGECIAHAVSFAGLKITEQPAASAAIQPPEGIAQGKFHGGKTKAGPTPSNSRSFKW